MKPSPQETKRKLESLLKKHRYTRDDRSDHREWMKYSSAFRVQIRLDQNNPKGFNGFQFLLTTYLRWNIASEDVEALLLFLKKEFS